MDGSIVQSNSLPPACACAPAFRSCNASQSRSDPGRRGPGSLLCTVCRPWRRSAYNKKCPALSVSSFGLAPLKRPTTLLFPLLMLASASRTTATAGLVQQL